MRPFRFISLLALALTLVAALSLLPPLDYSYFSGTARAWLAGESQLYDAGAPQFFYAPWSLLILAPLAPLPDAIGRGIFSVLSLAGVVWGMASLSRGRLDRPGLVAFAAPPMVAMLLLAQWEGLLLAGAGLGWLGLRRRSPWLLGFGILLISTKPTHILPVALLLLYGARAWRRAELARAAAPLLVALALSVPACGADWPLRYLGFLWNGPPAGFNVSLEQLTGLPTLLAAAAVCGALAWVVWAQPLSGDHLALGLVTGLLAAPFVVPYHYALAAPALALALRRYPRIGLALWALSAAGLVAFVLRWDALLLLPAFLAALWASLILWMAGDRRAGASSTPDQGTSASPTRSG